MPATDIICSNENDRPWAMPLQNMRLTTLGTRIDQALDRVEKDAEELKRIALAWDDQTSH